MSSTAGLAMAAGAQAANLPTKAPPVPPNGAAQVDLGADIYGWKTPSLLTELTDDGYRKFQTTHKEWANRIRVRRRCWRPLGNDAA
jgi:hypothetical protein